MHPDSFFLPAGSSGQRFCIYHQPTQTPCKGQVVYLHPFAEEMNKSRRMAALQSRALAASGFAVLQIDLHGCGDSSGEFVDASWQSWIADVGLAVDWLAQRSSGPLWLWALRGSCLLATDAARANALDCNFLFWQPSVSGKQVLTQFLRLRLAAELAAGADKGLMASLRAALDAGESVDVAGYTLPAALAAGLSSATLAPASPGSRLEWLEVSSRADAELSPASVDCLQRWRDAGHTVAGQLAHGPAFWHSTEIEESADLLARTLAAVSA